MQKVKRKADGDQSSPPKKKKFQKVNIEIKKPDTEGPTKKKFHKNDPKTDKHFNKIEKNGKSFGKSGFKEKRNTSDQNNGEKPKWSEMKKEKKQLRIIRRKAKSTTEVFEISHKAKLLATQIQRKVMKPDFRAKSCNELHSLLKGQYKTIALTHDLSRVIQVLLKHSPENVKNEITEELLDIMVQMIQSKYAHHAVKRILKYGTDKIRHEVLKKFFGHIVSIATHSVSAPVLDYAYGEFATKKEKSYMQQEFYGDIYKNSKDDNVRTLADTYKDTPGMKPAMLQSCKANIQRILDKNLHDGELFHSVLYDYIRECSVEDRTEMISTLSPLIVPLSNSLPGVNTASLCIWQGTNKDKKTILKVVKEHVIPLCKHKTGYRLLIAIFHSVDDTVLVKKTIITTIVTNLKDVAKDHWGNMVLHWLVKPKDSAAFHPAFVKFIEEGAKCGTSKKDAELRVNELRDAILPPLKQDFESDPDFWLSSKANMLLAITVLSIESSKNILESFAKSICRSEWRIKAEEKDILAVEDAGIHMCLKKLAALDKDKDDYTLGEAVAENLDDDTIELWLQTNRGCFFLLKLIESNNLNTSMQLIKKIKAQSSMLKKQTSEGAKILLQNIQKK